MAKLDWPLLFRLPCLHRRLLKKLKFLQISNNTKLANFTKVETICSPCVRVRLDFILTEFEHLASPNKLQSECCYRKNNLSKTIILSIQHIKTSSTLVYDDPLEVFALASSN